LRVVKAIVFVLTISIFFTFGLVIYKLTENPSKNNTIEKQRFELNQPAGSEIQGFKIDGEFVYIHVKNGGKKERILVIDTNKNKTKSEIIL